MNPTGLKNPPLKNLSVFDTLLPMVVGMRMPPVGSYIWIFDSPVGVIVWEELEDMTLLDEACYWG